MCCKTQRLKVQSQYRRRRRWSIDKWPKNKMQKETKLEEFRSFRTSKRRKTKRQRSDEREEVKTQNCFICVTKNSSEKLNNQVVIETERKHLVEFEY